MQISKLVGQDLAGYHFVMWNEVFKTDMDGRYSHSVAFLTDGKLADVYAINLVDSMYHKVQEIVVLTNDDKTGFIINESSEFCELADEQVIRKSIDESIAKKLSAEELEYLKSPI